MPGHLEKAGSSAPARQQDREDAAAPAEQVKDVERDGQTPVAEDQPAEDRHQQECCGDSREEPGCDGRHEPAEPKTRRADGEHEFVAAFGTERAREVLKVVVADRAVGWIDRVGIELVQEIEQE